MVLHDINENKSWIQMNWKCGFGMPWANILYAVNRMLPLFQNPEILIGNKGANGERANPADNPPEKDMLVIQGYSTHFKGNVAIVFYTKTNDVKITIHKNIGFSADYKSLAIAVGPFMDSIELRMYTAK
jgi:hypothetical protein